MDIDLKSTYIAFCDGACSGNPGPGGWGAVIASPKGGVKELGGHEENTTNNQMELQAVIEALRLMRKYEGNLAIISDSLYVLKGITQWIWAWRKNDWKSKSGEEISNQSHWKKLAELVSDRKKLGELSWHYVRGHNGNPGNERVDEIAVAFSKRQYITLYNGPLLKYEVPIHDLPDDTSIPEWKPKSGEKKQAFSYISVVNGVAQKHQSWSDCEARVKGRSGAKFKKTSSQEDELELLLTWGIDPKLVNE